METPEQNNVDIDRSGVSIADFEQVNSDKVCGE